MMPSPVNIALRTTPPSPAKPSPTPSASGGSAADGFREELTRQRGAEASATSDAPPKSQKRAEPKRATKPNAGKPVRAGRRERADDEPDTRFAAADKAEAKSPPADSGDDAPAVDSKEEAGHPEKAAGEHPDEGDAEAAPAVAASLVVQPATGQAELPDAPAADDAETGAAAQPAVDALRRAVFHAPDVPADAEESVDAKADAPARPPSGQHAAEEKVAPLFRDSSPKGMPDSADGGDSVPRGDSAQRAQALSNVEAVAEPSGDDPAQPIPADHAGHAALHDADFSVSPPAAFGDARPMAPQTTHALTAPPAPDALPPEARFAAANHENIVTSMRAEVLPNGGTMRIRLDPPQLGAMQVTVRIQDGLVTAAFETSSDEATRLLGHSLNQLKATLETHGVAVDRLQVQQAPRETQSSNSQSDSRREQGGQSSHDQEQSARQEQQRREMLRKMWRRLTGEPDPLDLTA
jgi:flagellar hook-length control protein FliK